MGFFKRSSTKESKILYEADMINLLGPFGVIKSILESKRGSHFNDIVKNILIGSRECLDDLQTETGKK